MYNLKWKIYDIKRTPVKKKIFSGQKWLRKMHLKNVVITYKSQILKFKIQQKVFYKKRCRMIHLNVPNFLYTNNKSLIRCLKCKKRAIFLIFSIF